MKTRGRQPKYNDEQRDAMCYEYYNTLGMSYSDFAAKYNISRATAARYFAEWREKQQEIISQEI